MSQFYLVTIHAYHFLCNQSHPGLYTLKKFHCFLFLFLPYFFFIELLAISNFDISVSPLLSSPLISSPLLSSPLLSSPLLSSHTTLSPLPSLGSQCLCRSQLPFRFLISTQSHRRLASAHFAAHLLCLHKPARLTRRSSHHSSAPR